jgi:hypothetical protein
MVGETIVGKQGELYICYIMKWLPFENVLGVWNFSAVLQNVCFDKLNVFCQCKIEYTSRIFFYAF